MELNINEYMTSYHKSLAVVLNQIDLKPAYDMILKHMRAANPIYVCGNGGSAAIADHFACDMYKGVDRDTNLLPNVISLSSNMSHISAIANDEGYEHVFSAQLKNVPPVGLLIVISSSGNSLNIVKALIEAKLKGMDTIALVGFAGGRASEEANIVIHAHAGNYGIVEDAHSIVMHNLAQYLRIEHQHQSAALKL